MPKTMTLKKAVKELRATIEQCPPDVLREVYKELFYGSKITEAEVLKHPEKYLNKILDHIDAGLEIEEILSLWGILFPTRYRRFYNEIDDVLEYKEERDLEPETY
jgi:hypothetical protein